MGTEEYLEKGHIGRWERWYRKMMGLTDSPYHACQAITWSKITSLGNRRETINPFKWDRVLVNLT